MYYVIIIGRINPSIGYSNGSITLHYSRGDDGRTFNVRLICGHTDTTIFAVDGDIPRGTLHYNFTLYKAWMLLLICNYSLLNV